MCDFAICQYCSKELNFSCLTLKGMMGGRGKILVNQDFRLLFFCSSDFISSRGRERSSRGVVTLLFSVLFECALNAF